MTAPGRLSSIRSSLRRLGPAAAWSQATARLGVVACTAVAMGIGLVYFVHAVDRLGEDASRNAAENYDDREVGGGNSLVVDKSALYEMRALVPEDETYRVVTGPSVVGATELTEQYIDQYARYFLMPRRPAPDGRWLLCYGCDLSQLGPEAEVVWRNDAGIAIARLPS